jgi:hypothetical protein
MGMDTDMSTGRATLIRTRTTIETQQAAPAPARIPVCYRDRATV